MADENVQYADIERRMNVQTQQFLIRQNNYNRAMIELHERELLHIWTAISILGIGLIVFGFMMDDKEKENA